MPNNEGNEVPVDAPMLPKNPPEVAVAPPEAEPKSFPSDAPVDVGVPKGKALLLDILGRMNLSQGQFVCQKRGGWGLYVVVKVELLQ